jgi:6-phosphogluconolactonase (cycloisomerase 2 family)
MKRCLLAFLVAMCVLPAGAGATVTGLLTRVGCVAEGPSNSFGCASARGINGTVYMVISPDGRSAYTTARSGNSVAVFRRNRRTGALQQLAGPAGCISDAGADHCSTGHGLAFTADLAISPDGQTVYVASTNENTVTWFQRNVRSGALREAGCFVDASQPPVTGCSPVTGLYGSVSVAASPDGRNVYAVAPFSSTLAAFAASGGRLRYLSCIADQRSPVPGCASAPGLGNTSNLTISPDGRQVYVAGQGSNAVTTFTRDPASGALTEQSCVSGDNGQGQAQGCSAGIQVLQPQFLALSPDSRFLYASASSGSDVIAFARSPNGQLTELPLPTGCVSDFDLGSEDCEPAVGLESPNGIAITRDLQNLYTASYGDSAVAGFSRNVSSGLLSPLGACLASGDNNCVLTEPLDHAGYATLSPDDRFLYINAPYNSAITIFGRSFPLTFPTTKIAHPKLGRRSQLLVGLSCPRRGIAGCLGRASLVVFTLGGLTESTIASSAYDLLPGDRGKLTLRVRPAELRRLKLGTRFSAWVLVTANDTAGDSGMQWRRVRVSR